MKTPLFLVWTEFSCLCIQVVQILEQPADKHVWAQRFLRLSDDRGWVVENHPKVPNKLPHTLFLTHR